MRTKQTEIATKLLRVCERLEDLQREVQQCVDMTSDLFDRVYE